MALRAIPIRRAGNRSNLFMGGDRELVMLSGLLAALIFSAQELRATIIGLVLWFGALFACRLMAKSDPRPVYLRHRKYIAIASLGTLLLCMLAMRIRAVDAGSNLKQHRAKDAGLADLLNYAAMVDDGIIVGKNGSFIAAWMYQGDDNASSTIWTGMNQAPCPLYPPSSPALMHCVTHGATPFRLNLHVRDLGHTFMSARPAPASRLTWR